MNKLEFSPLIKKKMKSLKGWLTEHFDEDVAGKVLTGMISDAEVLMLHEREDFMMKLFGVAGRTQESIDYWGE